MERAEDLRIDVDGAVLIATIDNPKRGNALSAAGAVALAEALDEVTAGDGAVRAVLVRSEGRHFCAGADISGSKRGGDKPRTGHMVRSLVGGHHRAIASVVECRVPVVAAVTGAAVGFGFHLALAADLAVVGPSTTVSEPFADRGFNVDSGGSWLVPRAVGLARAKQLLFLGQQVNGPTLVDWGVAAEVVDDDAVDDRARTLADDLAGRATVAIAATKRLLHDHLQVDLRSAMHGESMAVELTIRSDDFKEGMSAFMSKRDPDFQGR